MALIVSQPFEEPPVVPQVFDKVHMLDLTIRIRPDQAAVPELRMAYKLYRTDERGIKHFANDVRMINIRDVDQYVIDKLQTSDDRALNAFNSLKQLVGLLVTYSGEFGDAAIQQE